MRAYRVPIILVTVLLIAQIVIEMYRPKPVNWEPTFDRNDKIPYGTYILYKILPDLFGKDNIKKLNRSLYNAFSEDEADSIGTADKNYLFITQKFQPDSLGIERLMSQTVKGANVFIASQYLSEQLSDTLGIEIETNWFGFSDDTIDVVLCNKQLPVRTYRISRKLADSFFTVKDTDRVVVLGYNNDEKPNFVKIECGKGTFFLYNSPFVFSNYALLNDTIAQYAATLLSHLPQRPTYWDEYYQNEAHKAQQQSPLRYFMSVPALRYFILVLTAAFLLFLFFDAKRKQRIIPIIEPLRNSSLDFTKTVGLLYFQKGDHKDVAEKKIAHFFDHLRSRYFIQAIQFKTEFYEQVANKTGTKQDDITQIFKLIVAARTQPEINPDTLLDLSHRIDRFYAQTKTTADADN